MYFEKPSSVQLSSFTHNLYLVLVLQMVKDCLLYKLYKTYFESRSTYIIFFSLLTPFAIYQSLYQPQRVYVHVLLLLLLNYHQNKNIWIVLGILILIQPTFFLMVVPIFINKAPSEIKSNLRNLIIPIIAFFLFSYFQSVKTQVSYNTSWEYYLQMYKPSLCEPKFNLMWFFFCHLFLDYQVLFSVLFFLLPFLFIYPLLVIFKKTSQNRGIVIEFNFCLLIILLTSTATTIYDVYFFYLLMIPGYYFYSKIPAAIAFIIGGVVFGGISQVFKNDWMSSFTIGVSYVYYMMMVSYAFIVIFQVEVLQKLSDPEEINLKKNPQTEKQSKLEQQLEQKQ